MYLKVLMSLHYGKEHGRVEVGEWAFISWHRPVLIEDWQTKAISATMSKHSRAHSVPPASGHGQDGHDQLQ